MSWSGKTTCACVLVINKDGRILSVSRKGSLSDWGLPGGHLLEIEEPIIGANRELQEETGLIIPIRDLIFLHRSPAWANQESYSVPRDIKSEIVETFLYIGEIDTFPTIFPEIETGVAVAWVNFNKILEGSFGFYNNKVISAFLARQRRAK